MLPSSKHDRKGFRLLVNKQRNVRSCALVISQTVRTNEQRSASSKNNFTLVYNHLVQQAAPAMHQIVLRPQGHSGRLAKCIPTAIHAMALRRELEWLAENSADGHNLVSGTLGKPFRRVLKVPLPALQLNCDFRGLSQAIMA